jgi:hypothetical protein
MAAAVAFGAFVAAAAAAVWIKRRRQEVVRVTSEVDGRSYLVLRLTTSRAAADLLARINIACAELLAHLEKNHGDKACVQRLLRRYDPSALSEGTPNNGYSTSYSVDKGRKIVVCLRQTDHSFVELNVLLYVVFHELAHLMTVSIGHQAEFWTNFKFMLKEAVAQKLYQPTDYAKQPQAYCGIQISQSIL